MKKSVILRILSYVLTLSLLLGMLVGCSTDSSNGVNSSEKTNTTNNDASNTVAVLADEVIIPEGLDMTPICKNGSRVLFANMTTGEFAIQDQTTGKIWHSNPPDREEDPFFGADRAKVFSILTLHCLNTETMVDEYLTSFSDSELEDGIVVKVEKDGLLITFNFDSVKISVPLKITLTNDGFKAKVDVTAITEGDVYKSMDIGILPYFGAAGVNDEGYMVVPDGSGALIYFNNEKHSLRKYSAAVYGSDPILNGETKGSNSQYVALPLFGVKNGDNAFGAIITDGDAVATITAGVSKSGSGYNNVFAEFLLRSSGTDVIGGKNIRTYEKGISKVKKCEISYTFLSEDSANYIGMANVYRDYLANQMKLDADNVREFSVFLELYGAIRVKESVMGFPAKVTKTITTFEQAQTIVSQLKAKGVDNLIVAYQDADDNSLNKKVASNYSPVSKLGGKKQYKKLIDAIKKWNIPLISNINFTTFQNSGNGFSTRTDSAQLFTGLPGLRYSFRLNTGVVDESAPMSYFLSPHRYDSVITKFLNKYDVASCGYIGLDTLAKDVYSDFSAKNGSGRQETLNLSVKAAELLAKKSPLYVRNGNGRLVPYTSYIYDMASSCSYFDIIDESVPIYQIAVSGLVPYSLEALNTSTDADLQLLKCVEYGADIKFNLSYTDFGILGDPAFGYLNGTLYTSWKDYIIKANERLSVLNGQLGNGRIVAHQEVAEGLFVTTYDNSTKVIVNYNEAECMFEDISVKGKDFAVVKGGADK